MLKITGNLKKRLTAGLMAFLMLGSSLLPDYAGIGSFLSFESYAASVNESTGLKFGLTFVPNSGVMKNQPGWEGKYNRNMLRKEYFTGGTGEYAKFGGKYTWCVSAHTVHAPIGTTPRVKMVGTYTDLPNGIDKFNFTMALIALYYFSQPGSLSDPYADLADYLIAKCIIAPAYETGELHNEWEWDQMRILSVLEEYYAKEFNPDSKGSTLISDQLLAPGYKYGPNDSRTGKYDEYKLWQVWSAAHALCEMDWQQGVGFAKNVTAPEMGSDGKYHVYAEFNADDVNGKYFESLRAQTMYGDWTFEGYSGGRMDFSSPTGEIPAEGIADMAYEPGSSFDNIFTNFTEGEILELSFDGGYQGMLVAALEGNFKVKIGTATAAPKPHGEEEVKRYKHEETWNATYNVNLYKFDSETGKPLSGAMFDILEAFDDSQLYDTDLDRNMENPGSYVGSGGSLVATEWGVDDVASNWSGDTGYVANDADKYNWGNDEGTQFERWIGWDDPCTRDNDITNSNGQLTVNSGSDEASSTIAHTDVKTYEYVKGYCGGHPAPEIEYAELTGDPAADAAIEEANQALHDEAWEKWAEGVEECENLAAEGGFFHAIEEGAAKEALIEDRNRFYQDFISLQYDYSAEEVAQREGYVIHGGHTDDILIEEVRITSSEYKDTDGASKLSFSSGSGLSSAPLLSASPVKSEEPAMDNMIGDSLEVSLASEEEHAGILEEAAAFVEEEFLSGETENVTSGDAENVTTPEKENIPETAGLVDAVMEVEEVEEVEEVKNISFLDRFFSVLTAYAEEPETAGKYIFEEEPDPATPSEAANGTDSPSGTGLTGLLKKTASKLGEFGSEMMMLLGVSLDSGKKRASTSFETSEVAKIGAPDSTIIAHTFTVFDHRVEGEIHINKRDFDLSDSDKTNFDDYAEVNGDGTLEGAVYGLFARTPIVHPDGVTGTVFAADELVAVATTDRNGDASFSVITCAPGTTYNYADGAPKHTGSAGPGNLHTSESAGDAFSEDNEKYIGHENEGGEINIADSAAGDGTFYRKKSSNQTSVSMITSATYAEYPILNNEALNGNCWIGRPLILGEYYVKELSRSEGYELSVYGASQEGYSNRSAFETGGGSLTDGTAAVVKDSWQINMPYTGNEFQVAVSGIGDAGFDIYVNNVSSSVASALTPTVKPFYIQRESGTAAVTVDDYDYREVDAEPGTFVLINGNKVELASVPSVVALPNGENVTAAALSSPEDTITVYEPNNIFTNTTAGTILEFAYASDEEFTANVNASLSAAGYQAATTASPYILISKTGSRAEWCHQINLYLADMLWCNAFSVEDAGTNIVFRYDYIQPSPACTVVSDTQHNVVLVAEPVTYGGTPGHIWVPYASSDWITVKYKSGTFVEQMSAVRRLPSSDTFGAYEDLSSVTYDRVMPKKYWVYAAGEKLRNANGDIVSQYVKIGSHPETQPTTEEKRTYDATPKYESVTYDAAHQRYVIHVSKAQAAYSNPSEYPYIGYELVWASSEAAGVASCYYANDHLSVTASASPKTAGLYIKYVTLSYNDGKVMEDAGTVASPVKVNERPIRQRIAVKKDILLDADMDNDGKGDRYKNNTFGDAVETAVPDFKFKAYLKSNLERLYRTADGTVQWTDVNGNEMTPVISGDTLTWTVGGTAYDWPEVDKLNGTAIDSLNVQPIYTVVPHESSSKTVGRISNNVWNDYKAPSAGLGPDIARLNASSTSARTLASLAGGKAVRTNDILYSYLGKNTNVDTTDTLRDNANTGYTRILESIDVEMEDGGTLRTIRTYNYDKFFDALAVANHDKWDDADPTYTSYKPIGNKANRSNEQVENAKRSDAVRQFAIDWYLQDEVAKLVKSVGASSVDGKMTEDEAKKALADNDYQDNVYDEALYKAILKAENYLKPFFRYDLDTIYSLQWDTEAGGGVDADLTTLSASASNTKADGNDEYYNTSAYLPYGTYIVVEQQPGYTGTDLTAIEYLNKHYEKDRPKEVMVPSVYAGTVNNTADNYDSNYKYEASQALTEQAKSENFLIRFGEEWKTASDDARQWVIRAHSYYGNFEVYPYGLDVDKLKGNISSGAYTGFTVTQEDHDPVKDYYDTAHHGEEGVTSIGTALGGNNNSKWDIENLNGGLEPTANGTSAYDSKDLRDRTYYASISEDAGTANNVRRTNAASTEDNVPGYSYSDGVLTMTGVQTAYDGNYAPMLVPWSVLDTVSMNTYSGADFAGYADVNEMNRFYSAKLRIEKLDSETHENILHDGATFQIYKAQRDATTGVVMIYSADTDITGSKEFITAYCDKKTVMPVDPENPRGEYKGTVKAGTPVCYETDLVTLGDAYGNEVGEFEAFSTTIDVPAKDEMTDIQETPANYIRQNAGYLELPEPLGAGVYVLIETVVPSGYVRTKPVAVEIYSDKVIYYKEGNTSERVIAEVFEEENERKADAAASGIGTDTEATNNKNKPQDTVDVADIYIEDAPIKLTVEKVKESSAATADTTSDKSVTYKVSGRVEGTMAEIGGRDDLEYVYLSGKFQGYAYYKGTLEYLAQLKKIYEDDGDPLTKVEIVYDTTLFTGYAYVTRLLETSDDDNKYVTGAKLTLVDAIQLRRNETYAFGSSDYGDYAFSFPDGHDNHGLIVVRDNITSNVRRMYVEQGYAGSKTIYKVKTDAAGNPITVSTLTGYTKEGKPVYTEGYKYISETVERPATDILFYDLDSLEVTEDVTEDGITKHYGYDKAHNRVDLALLEHDKANFEKTDNEFSIYAFKGGIPTYEFVGGDFNNIQYNQSGKYLKVDSDTVVYHLDEDGNRDSMVDPKTGMAYVIEKAVMPDGTIEDKYLVWATEVYKDEYGNVIARDKITTSRVGTIGENDSAMMDVLTTIPAASFPDGGASSKASAGSYEHKESGSVSGTWVSDAGEESHHETSDRTNKLGQNMNGEMLLDDNNGDFLKEYKPVYDENGNIVYYQRNAETYDKGSSLYDRNGDFVRYDNSDLLKEYDDATYAKNDYTVLYDADQTVKDPATKVLYHRYGEGYVLENTWITSDKTPNDPFEYTLTDGQADIIKRVPEGTYIIEETFVPNGDTNGAYVKAFPVGITVNETTEAQFTKVVDHTTKIEIAKISGTNDYKVDVLAMDDGGKKIGEVPVEKSSYTYSLIGGATLALYKAEKKYSSDYEKYPKGYYLVKTETTPLKYHPTNWKVSDPVELTAQWTTAANEPLYLEGIPQGFYILEELSAPEGFVKAGPIEIELKGDLDVQEIPMNDDHTKVEIEKIYLDEYNKPQLLRGAKLELHEAKTDSYGNPLLDADGNPTYESTALLTFVTSDAKEYANLPAAFEAMFSAHGINGESFEYVDDKGVTHTMNRDTIEYSYDWALSGGTALQYPTDAKLIYKDAASGRKVRISVFQQKQAGSKINYSCDYEFDWINITAINGYCDSYITVNGDRRFNYLPIGKEYVIVETEAPAGYAKAQPKLVTVEDTADVQRYMIEDTESKLVISKVITGRTKETEGIRLSLYKADGSGNFVKDELYKVDTWVTGTDGVYTSEDALLGQIPSGYAAGDLRAHEVKELAAGIYYLYEDEPLPYYTRIDPLMIDYTDLTEVKFVRAENAPVKGQVTLYKKAPDGSFLTGATYEVSKYCASDLTTPVETLTYTDTTGTLDITGMEVGEVSTGEDGTVTPFTYKIKEIAAPTGYSVIDKTYTFKFDPEKEGGLAYDFGDIASKEYTYIDAKTTFRFSKKDFDSLCDDTADDAFIEGAVINLYELTGIDADGNPIYDTALPLKTITTKKIEHTVEITGLTGGKSYVFVEAAWPVGWNLMKPVMFTVSADGRKVTELTNKLSAVTFETVKESDFPMDTLNPDIDSIASATIHGRYVTSVTNEAVAADGTVMEAWPAGSTHVILLANGYTDGQSYTIVEKTRYSDGTVQVTDKETKNFFFDEDGTIRVATRKEDKVSLAIFYEDGSKIDGIDPVTDIEFEKTIQNSVMPENPVITVTQQGSEAGAPIDQTKLIYDKITFTNPTQKTADATITININDDTRWVDAGDGVTSGNTITFTLTDVMPFAEQSVEFITAHEFVNFDAHELDVTVTIAGKTLHSEKSIPVIKKNNLTIWNELTGSGRALHEGETSEFKVRFWYNVTGDELAGTYSYTGSKTGTIMSGDTIELAGNEYIIIDTGTYEDVHYTVERTDDGKEVSLTNLTGNFTDARGAYARCRRTITNTSERDIFRKGETYHLIEKTSYTDGIEVTTNRISFGISENGSMDTIVAFDLGTRVAISKADITDGTEIPGCELTLWDTNGTPDDTSDDIEIETWTSTDKPHMFEEVLEFGKEYRLTEVSAAPGYAYTEDVLFTVDSEGYIVQKVVMVDKPTDVLISKADLTTGEPVAGATLQIIDKDGTVIKEWTTDATGSERFVCTLIADETYTLREKRPADGWGYQVTDVTFMVSHDGTIDRVVMEDDITKAELSKKDLTTGEELPGCEMEVFFIDEEGKEVSVETWISGTEPHRIDGKLIADREYILRELNPAPGYGYAEDVKFTVNHEGGVITKAEMKDDVLRNPEKPEDTPEEKPKETRYYSGGGLMGYEFPKEEPTTAVAATPSEVPEDDENKGTFHVSRILGAGGRRTPDTGDDSNIGMFFAAMVISGLMALLLWMKRNQDEK